MLYREIIVVCSEIDTKHINTVCGQNVELLYVKSGGTWRRIITMCLRDASYEDVGWIHPVHDYVQWRADVHEVMNIPGAMNCNECLNLRSDRLRHVTEPLV